MVLWSQIMLLVHLIEFNLIKPDLPVDLLHLPFPVSDHLVLSLELIKLFSVELALDLLLICSVKSFLRALSFVMLNMMIFDKPFANCFNITNLFEMFWALVWSHRVPKRRVIDMFLTF